MNDLVKKLSAGQTARRLGVSTVRVAQLRERGDLHAVRTPLGYLYEPREVERLANERRQRAAASADEER